MRSATSGLAIHSAAPRSDRASGAKCQPRKGMPTISRPPITPAPGRPAGTHGHRPFSRSARNVIRRAATHGGTTSHEASLIFECQCVVRPLTEWCMGSKFRTYRCTHMARHVTPLPGEPPRTAWLRRSQRLGPAHVLRTSQTEYRHRSDACPRWFREMPRFLDDIYPPSGCMKRPQRRWRRICKSLGA